MSQQWYYTKNGQQQGPILDEQLKQLAASEQILPSDLIWKDGMSQWTEARQIGELFLARNGISPPPLSGGHTANAVVLQNPGRGLIAAGYICGVLALFLFPQAFGLAGTVCEIVNLVKGNIVHGVAQIVISVSCMILGMIIGAALISM